MTPPYLLQTSHGKLVITFLILKQTYKYKTRKPKTDSDKQNFNSLITSLGKSEREITA